MVADMVWLGIALLLAPALAEYGKMRAKAAQGFAWVAAGGVSLLLAEVFTVDLAAFGITAETLAWGTALFGVIGLILALIGTILVLKSVLM
ncbi:MAG: hypothetical protein ACE5J7_00035 [Candidatus Aenigmatarchaeota archaeon]